MITQSITENKDFSGTSLPEDDLGKRVMRDNLKFGSTELADAILAHPKLSRRAKLVYATLVRHAGEQDYCCPSQETIARESSMSVDTVQRALCDLRDFNFSEICGKCSAQKRCEMHTDGLVAWKQRGLNLTNMYCITPIYSSYDELASGKPQNVEEKSRKKPEESNLPSSNLSQKLIQLHDSNHSFLEKEKKGSKKAWEAWKEAKEKREQLPSTVATLISDLSLEWGDVDHLVSNLTQTANLFLFAKQHLRYTEGQFFNLLDELRSRVSSRVIHDIRNGRVQRMKYFFACVRNELYGRRE